MGKDTRETQQPTRKKERKIEKNERGRDEREEERGGTWCDTGLGLLCGLQLLVRRGSGVNHERLGITHICQVARHLAGFDKLASCFLAALDLEAQHSSVATGAEVLIGQGLPLVTFKGAVGNKLHLYKGYVRRKEYCPNSTINSKYNDVQ